VKAFDVVITMGCGNMCSNSIGNATRTGFGRPGRIRPRPRPTHRDEIRQGVRNLIAELTAARS
jgi:hypothetical protein